MCDSIVILCYSCSIIEPPPPCIPNADMQEELCGLFTDSHGNPFGECFIALAGMNGDEVETIALSCYYDVCAMQDDVEQRKIASCGALNKFSEFCQLYGIIVDWREAANCRKYLSICFCPTILDK